MGVSFYTIIMVLGGRKGTDIRVDGLTKCVVKPLPFGMGI